MTEVSDDVRQDLLLFGYSFTLDGKRVAPEDVLNIKFGEDAHAIIREDEALKVVTSLDAFLIFKETSLRAMGGDVLALDDLSGLAERVLDIESDKLRLLAMPTPKIIKPICETDEIKPRETKAQFRRHMKGK